MRICDLRSAQTEQHALDATVLSHYRVLYERQRLLGKSVSQRKNHEIALRQFERFLGRAPLLSDLSDRNVTAAMQWLMDNGRAPRTANKFKDCICAQWSFYKRKGIDGIREWPEVENIPVPERVPQCWSQEQLASIYRVIVDQRGLIADVPAPTWWCGFVSVIYDTGERRYPVEYLPEGDVDFRAGTVLFRADHRKGKTRDIVRSLHTDTVMILASMARGEPELPIFRLPFCTSTLYGRFKKILKQAGLSSDRSSMFHKIRKTTASFFEAAGGNATDLLDHSSRRVTMRYLDPSVIGGVNAINVLPRPNHPDRNDDGPPRAA